MSSDSHDSAEQRSIDRALGSDASAGPVAAEDAVAAAAIGQVVAPVALPAGSVGRLLDRVRAVGAGDTVVRRDEEAAWDEHPAPGVKVRILRRNEATRRVTLLLHMDPGARYPAHQHPGDEECYVIEGDLCTEKTVLRAGDYQFMPGGSQHGELWSVDGCRCIVTLTEAAAA